MAESLHALRQKIDLIDNELLTLLGKRQDLSRAIATQKTIGSNVFRPDREVSLLRNLIAGHSDVSKQLIVGLWRHIISASIAEQKPDYTIAHSPLALSLAELHGAGYMRLRAYEGLIEAVDGLGSGVADCLIIAQDELDSIANRLGVHSAGDVFVAASIGFLHEPGQKRGYVLCRELPDVTGDDVFIMRDATGTLSHYRTDEVHAALPEEIIVGTYASPIAL